MCSRLVVGAWEVSAGRWSRVGRARVVKAWHGCGSPRHWAKAGLTHVFNKMEVFDAVKWRFSELNAWAMGPETKTCITRLMSYDFQATSITQRSHRYFTYYKYEIKAARYIHIVRSLRSNLILEPKSKAYDVITFPSIRLLQRSTVESIALSPSSPPHISQGRSASLSHWSVSFSSFGSWSHS